MNVVAKSYIDTSFESGFLVSDEAVVKLHDIVVRRLKERGVTTSPKWKVLRVDSLVYDTESPSEIVGEENSKRNLISRLELSTDCELLKLRLSFDKKEKTSLRIESPERDFALLLNSDIKEYLQTEVLVFRSFLFSKSKIETLIPGLLFPIVLMGAMAYSFSKYPKKEDVDAVLSSADISAKINFLIEDSSRRTSMPFSGKWLLISIGVLIAFFAALPALDAAFPRNIFCIGKEKARYDGLCAARSRWLWGGGISFVVSCVAGVAVWYFTT